MLYEHYEGYLSEMKLLNRNLVSSFKETIQDLQLKDVKTLFVNQKEKNLIFLKELKEIPSDNFKHFSVSQSQ